MIVIIGAGLAGLSAAHSLIELGYDDLLILEAKSKAGGRIVSHHFQDGFRVDLGAQWLHGAESNPIYHWLLELDCIEGPEPEECEFDGLFRSEGGVSPASNVIARVLELLLDAKRLLYKMSAMLKHDCRPVDIYRKHIEDEIPNCPILRLANRELIYSVLRWFEMYEAIDNSCEDLTKLSMRAYSDWTDYDDGQMVRLKGGWQNVVDKLVDEIGEKRIIFNCEANRITYTNDQVLVQHTNGVIFCDHVIVSLPLGVLKSLPKTFFRPSLPEMRLEGIRALGFGAANKIFLRFERPHLQKEKGLKLLWTNFERQNADSAEKLPDWCRYMTGFDVVSGSQNVLLCWVGGAGAKMMESFSDDQIGHVCLQVLRLFLPDRPPPPLVAVVSSRWATDRCFRGSYSYESIEASKIERSGLWDPIVRFDKATNLEVPRVLFAGEATAAAMYSTAHGAIVSGWREANRLAKFKDQAIKRDF